MSDDPTAQAAFRVPRSEVDAFYVAGEQAPPSRAGVGVVVSVDSSNLCTVVVNDEELAGVMWLGVIPPRVGDVVELELRGDLLVVPSSNDLDTYLEGMDQTVEHIVSADNPGSPPPQELQVGGSMRSTDAWAFWGTDTSNWARELSESGQGLRLYQPAPPVLVARNLATIPSGEAGIGPDDAGHFWTAGSIRTRTNLIPNPSFEVSTTGWGGGRATGVRTASATAQSGGWVTRVTNDGTSGSHYWIINANDKVAVVPGQILTFSAYVRLVSGAGTTYQGITFFYDAAVAGVSGPGGGPMSTISTGAWTRITQTFTVPPNAAWLRVGVNVNTLTSADVYEIDAAMLELSPTVGTYIEGTVVTLASGPGQVASTQERTYSGSLGFKATWVADPSPSAATLTIGGHAVGAQHTAQVWVWVPTGSPDVRLIVQGIGASAVTAVKDAWVQLTLTYTATAAEHVVGIATAAATATTPGSVYFDALSIVAGATPLAAYFDGGNVDSSTDQYEWLGTPHLSASEHWSGATLPAALLGTNFLTNPSFEIDLARWIGTRATLTRVASPTAVAGGWVARLVNDGSDNTHYLNNPAPRYPVAAGQTVTFSASARLVSGVGAGYRARIFWYDATNTVIGTGAISGVAQSLPSDGSWVRLTVTATAPEGAATCGPVVSTQGEVNTDTWEVDACLAELSGTLDDYFDGGTATTDDAAFRWEGTPHASTSTNWDSPTDLPPGPAGVLWSEMSFDVEPGDVVHFEMALGELAQDTTAQVYVLYGGVAGANPSPVDPDTVQAAVGSVLALTADISTLSADLTIPETVTLSVSGVTEPATVKLGVRLVGSGASQVLAVAASATHTPAGWPLGSQWMDPDAPDGGLITMQEMAIGNLNTILTNFGATDNPIPSAKKVTITAPKSTGGIAVVTFTGTFRIRTSTAATYLTLWDGTKEVGLVYFASGVTDAGWFPFVLRGTIVLAADEEVTIVPRYRYSSTSTTVPHELHRMQTMAEFYPGAVRSGGSAESPVRYWDGDSWRPEKLYGSVMDLTKDAATAPPAKTNTTTSLSRSASTLHSGSVLTLTSTTTSGAAGSVTFYRSSSSSGPWTSLGAATISSGKAVKKWTTTAGTWYFKATYGGSSSHNGSTSAVSPSTKVQKLVTKTVTLSCAWAQAYEGSGSKLSGTSHDSSVAQGQYSSTDGNTKSLLRFDHGSIPSSADVTSVSLICKSGGWDHWYNNSGGTLVLGSLVSQDSEPSTWPSSKTDEDRSRHAVDTGGWTVNISSWANGALESSSFSGIVVGPGASSSLVYYGYSATPAKDQFSLKVTYKYWD